VFYEAHLRDPKEAKKKIAAMIVLDPAESRRLLAKATVAIPEVRDAWRNGMIIIARGITNAYVAEELLGVRIQHKAAQAAGIVCRGATNVHAGLPPCIDHVFIKGQSVKNADLSVEILKFTSEDVFIKGASAIDPEGNPGVYVSSKKAGTIGMAWPVVTSRGSHLIMPISLEKLIPSVVDAAKHTGLYYFKYTMGLPVKLVPVPLARVITEIQAFAILAGVQAYHVGSGGVGGSEGSVHLVLEGEEDSVLKAFELAKSIKGEPIVGTPDNLLVSSPEDFRYDAQAQLGTLEGV
jgi:hypothetical protein